MERGEIWTTLVDGPRAVVVLSGDDVSEVRAIQVVARARVEEKHGFRLLSGLETSNLRATRMTLPADPSIRAVGVEVEIGGEEGLAHPGAVRIAFPHHGYIPCNWLVTLSRSDLVERTGRLSPAKLDHLADALQLAGLE